jgi:diguanylate cyclase (GGDEF)-like protein
MALALIFYNYHEEQIRQARDAVATARAMTQAIDRELLNVKTAAQVLATSPYLQDGDLRGFYDQAKSVVELQLGSAIVVFGSDGHMLLSTLRPFGDQLPPIVSDLLSRLIETRRPVLSDLFIGPITRRPVMSVEVPVFHDNQFVYDLAFAIPIDRFSDPLRDQHLPPGWIATVFDSSGTIAARTHETRFVGKKGSPELIKRMGEVSEDALPTITVEGIPVLSAFSRSGVSNWTVAIEIPSASLAKQLWGSLTWVVVGSAILLLTGIWLAWVIGGRMAKHDPLTELANRAVFQQRLDAKLDRAMATGEQMGVLCLGLDRFKETNDVFGRSVGDAALHEVARRLEVAAKGAFLARVGGDEFSLIADGPQPSSAESLAERLRQALNSDLKIGAHDVKIGASIGVAIFPGDGSDAAALVGNADAAMDRAKTDGGGIVRFFDGETDRRLREQRSLQHDLRTAIAHAEFAVYYQPQARLDRTIVGFEALARWRHPTRGMVPPTTFIPLAEESGIIFPLSAWILHEACREAASWPIPLHIAVNLSPMQFRQGDLTGLVRSVLAETGLAPGRLELEITEGVLINDYPRAISILIELKSLGVGIVLDDFGTGYSSFSYLQSFPFDKIKVDRPFIANLPRNLQSAAIIRAIIALGRGLGLPILAEGVETDDQFAFLVQESCDQFQGSLLGDAHPIEKYAALVGHGSLPARAIYKSVPSV